MNKRKEAEEIALNIIDLYETDITEDAINEMSNEDLYEWITEWGYVYGNDGWMLG